MIWWLNGFRQFRNPDETGVDFPPQAEWFHIYQHLSRDYSAAQYPVAGPGEPEGANLACDTNQFVFGSPVIDSEDVRITDPAVPLWIGLNPPQTPEEKWYVGKLQRGALHIPSGVGFTPALSAALSAFSIGSSYSSLHGKGFGGFLPAPTVLATDCGPDEDDGKNIPSYEVKFTALQHGVKTTGYHGSVSTNANGFSVITYAGSCPDFTLDTAVGHVWSIFRAPNAYYVFVNPGVFDVYPAENWLEGPYTGNGRLFRYDGGQISRMMWAYVSDRWRGTDAQRNPDTYNIKDIGFDFQAFHEKQFPLSPARGVISGGSIDAIYPTAAFTGNALVDGSFLNWTLEGGNKYHRFTGHVFAGCFYKATKLAKPFEIELINEAGSVFQTLTISPDENGDASDVIWFLSAQSATYIQARLKGSAKFKDATGSISIEIAELVEYKANFWDAYLAIRIMTTEGGDDEDLDTIDGDSSRTSAKSISDLFLRWGMIQNPSTDGIRTIREAINTNPVYDSFRKLSREMVKIIRRQEFISYGVANGKSVIRLKRWAFGLFNEKADLGYGMAPSFEPSSSIIEGEEYVVRALSGVVTYRGQNFSHGQRFIGAPDISDFQTTGDAQPFVYDGIKSIARKKGYTNEWCGFISTHAEHPSISSIWKPDAYADYYPFQDRCHFYAFHTPTELFRHINVNYLVNLNPRSDGTGYDIQNEGLLLGDLLISPESVTGYRYALGANGSGVSDNFCKSCRVYEAPRKVESCIIEPDMIAGGRNDVIKITFSERLHYDPVNAPASVNADVTTWSPTELSNLRAEPYRTDDNALREYSRYINDGTHGSWKVGDAAAFSTVQTLPDNPFGTIMPHFYFCKLVPKPYEDGNDSVDLSDSRLTIDGLRIAELWLKTMCEGFINGFTEQSTVCADIGTAEPYDYSFEDLCNAAFGGRAIGAFGLSFRSDAPFGHGPLPNTIAYADVFNRISQCTNLLHKVRLDFPIDIEFNLTTEENQTSVGSGCVELAGNHEQSSQCPSHGSSTSSGWTPGSIGSVNASSGFGGATYCDGSGGFNFGTSSEKAQYRFSPDSSFQYALPPEVLGLIQGGQISLWGKLTKTTTRPFSRSVSLPDGQECLTSAVWFPGTRYDFTTEVEDMGCIDIVARGLDAGLPPCGDFYFGSQADPASPPDSPCGNSSHVTISVDALADNTPSIISVPLVPWEP